MPELEKQHFPALVMDGSCPHFFTGILKQPETWAAQHQATGAPLEHLHCSVDLVMRAAATQLPDIKSFIYCAGPGSILGLRLCAMAIKTWQFTAQHPVNLWAYDPLQLAAHQYLQSQTIEENCWIICAWKQDYWHHVNLHNGCIESTRVIQQAELDQYHGQLYYMQQRKQWQQAPGSTRLEFQPENLPLVLEKSGWLRAVPEVALGELGQSQFEKWHPQPHSTQA
jgi:tRNA A37 threonylcarbamoyladenosine modification protein TsaB